MLEKLTEKIQSLAYDYNNAIAFCKWDNMELLEEKINFSIELLESININCSINRDNGIGENLFIDSFTINGNLIEILDIEEIEILQEQYMITTLWDYASKFYNIKNAENVTIEDAVIFILKNEGDLEKCRKSLEFYKKINNSTTDN